MHCHPSRLRPRPFAHALLWGLGWSAFGFGFPRLRWMWKLSVLLRSRSHLAPVSPDTPALMALSDAVRLSDAGYSLCPGHKRHRNWHVVSPIHPFVGATSRQSGCNRRCGFTTFVVRPQHTLSTDNLHCPVTTTPLILPNITLSYVWHLARRDRTHKT